MEQVKSFLIKLYSNEYFIYGLIGTIVLLIILFLIVLFFGKKDEKKRKLEATRELEKQDLNAFKETSPVVNVQTPVVENKVVENVIVENKPQEITPIIEPVVEQKVVEEPVNIVVEQPVINEPVIEAQPIEMPSVEPIIEPVGYQASKVDIPVETNVEPEFNFNFDKLANSIDQEIRDIEVKTEKQVIEQPRVEPVIKEENVTLNVGISSPRVAEPSPNLFSSVYVNKEENVSERKQFEMPKINNEVEVEKNTVPSVDELKNIALKNIEMNNENNKEFETKVNVFPDLTGETYDIK